MKSPGFTVQRVGPGERIPVGRLLLHTFTPDHVNNPTEDEVDVLPFLVCSDGEDGSFFSAIDVPDTPDLWRQVRNVTSRPTVWSYSQNRADWSVQYGWLRSDPNANLLCTTAIAESHLNLCRYWTSPALSLLSGSGLSFPSPIEHLNRRVFAVDKEQVCQALTLVSPHSPFISPKPGFVARVLSADQVETAENSEYVERSSPGIWPNRTPNGDTSLVVDFPALTSESELTASELKQLMTLLEGFAAHIAGTDLARGLYSLSAPTEASGYKRSTICLALRADEHGSYYTLEYDQTSCRFVHSSSDTPFSDYVAGFECWSRDLLEALAVRLTPSVVVYGHSRAWNRVPDLLAFDPGYLLRGYCRPLRRPQDLLELYRTETLTLQEETQ